MVEPTKPQSTTVPHADARSAVGPRSKARCGVLAALGAIGAALLASLCCIGPLLFVTLGVGAGLASRFEPLRPVFTALTLALLALGFYVAYGRAPAAPRGAAPEGAGCNVDGQCRVPRHRRRDTIVLWVATVVALLVLTFPQWSLLLR